MTAHISFRTPFRARTIWIHRGPRFTHWPDSLSASRTRPGFRGCTDKVACLRPLARGETQDPQLQLHTPVHGPTKRTAGRASRMCSHGARLLSQMAARQLDSAITLFCQARTLATCRAQVRTYMTNGAITRLPPRVTAGATPPALRICRRLRKAASAWSLPLVPSPGPFPGAARAQP